MLSNIPWYLTVPRDFFYPQPKRVIMSRKKKRLKIVDRQNFSNLIKKEDLKYIEPLTHNQQEFFNFYRKGNKAILLHGVAGTGKTYIALYNAFKEILEDNSTYQKVIIVRSAVPSRDIGFLPGNEKEKTEVYSIPYQEICSELFPRQGALTFKKLCEQGLVDFMITSYVRGLTLDNAIVIVDEAQNMNDMELNSIMTRIGKNSKIIFCGDFRQTDLSKRSDMSGLKKFMEIAKHMPTFRRIEFDVDDIVRSSLVREYILARMAMEDMVLMAS